MLIVLIQEKNSSANVNQASTRMEMNVPVSGFLNKNISENPNNGTLYKNLHNTMIVKSKEMKFRVHLYSLNFYVAH